MKLVIGFLVILIGGGALLYYAGGYGSFDPSKQGEEAKAKITPGMSWTQVADAAGEPREYRVLVLDVRERGGEKIETIKPGPANPFDRKRFEERQTGGGLPNGFIFPYTFSNSVAFSVHFDSAGNVTDVTDNVTMADLLQLKDR